MSSLRLTRGSVSASLSMLKIPTVTLLAFHLAQTKLVF